MKPKVFLNNLMRHTGCRNNSQLAKATGMDHAQISRLVHGVCSDITLRKLCTVSKLTGVSVSTLAGWFAGEQA